jgi:hypothetical protein
MLHKWAQGTQKTYHSKIWVFRVFEWSLRVPVLLLTILICPPNGPSIPLMWAQEMVQCVPYLLETKSCYFDQVYSCHVQCCQPQDLLMMHPEHLAELNDEPIFVNERSSTDKLSFIYFTAGLKQRIG